MTSIGKKKQHRHPRGQIGTEQRDLRCSGGGWGAQQGASGMAFQGEKSMATM